MKLIAIAYLFVMCWGLGYSLLRLLKIDLSKNLFENIVMTFGIGLGIFSVLALVLNIAHVPLHWFVFLAIGLIIPIYDLAKKRYNHKKEIFNIKLTKGNVIFLIVLLLFAIHLFVFVKGAFIYPYFEDGDPWWHATSIKYVKVHNTYSMSYELAGGNNAAPVPLFKYGEPYPPFYDVLLGIIHQIEPNLNWLIKFFNALFVSLSIPFIFFFLKRISRNSTIALTGAFLITMIPSYMSHFIFATTLAITLFFPALYAFSRIDEDKRWWIVAALITAGIFVMQPIASFWFVLILGTYWIISVLQEKDWKKYHFYSIFAGLAISQLFWIPSALKFGLELTAKKLNVQIFKPGIADSSLGKVYSLGDFAIARLYNMTDQPIGFGLFIFALLVIALVLYLKRIKSVVKDPQNRWILLSLIFVVITLLAVESNYFRYKFAPHRQWVYLTIFVVILSAYCFKILLSSLKDPKLRYGLIALFVMGVILTSGYPKYVVQTSMWPQTEFLTPQEAIEASWLMDNLPYGTSVFQFCTISRAQDSQVIVYNKEAYPWDLEILNFRNEIFNKTLDEVYSFVKQKRFDYILYGITCLMHYEQAQVQEKLEELGASPRFVLVHGTNSMWVFKVN
jgi:hypothetical protein